MQNQSSQKGNSKSTAIPSIGVSSYFSRHVSYFQTSDPCQHADTLPEWSQEYIQLSGGVFTGQIREFSSGPVQLFRETMNQAVIERGQARPNAYVIGIPVAIGEGGYWQGHDLAGDSLLALSPGEDLYFRAPKASDIFVCVIDDKVLENYAAVAYGEEASVLIQKAQMRHLNPRTAQNYRYLLNTLLKSVHDTPEILCHWASRQALTEKLIDSSLNAAASLADSPQRLQPRQFVQRAIVERARAYILSLPDEPPTVSGLCAHLKMSRRGLHHAFFNVLGISSIVFLRYVRLHGARKSLLAEGGRTTVSDVACRWGFTHMGMFANYYKSLFGESPSVTQKSATRIMGRCLNV